MKRLAVLQPKNKKYKNKGRILIDINGDGKPRRDTLNKDKAK
jgi:hypothetical protein